MIIMLYRTFWLYAEQIIHVVTTTNYYQHAAALGPIKKNIGNVRVLESNGRYHSSSTAEASPDVFFSQSITKASVPETSAEGHLWRTGQQF